jgi:hypothetical protein
VEVSGQPVSRPGRFTPGTHWMEGWVSPKASLNAVAKRKKYISLSGIEYRSPSQKPVHYYYNEHILKTSIKHVRY